MPQSACYAAGSSDSRKMWCVCVSDSVLLCVFVSTRRSGEPAGACSGSRLHMHTFIRKYVCT